MGCCNNRLDNVINVNKSKLKKKHTFSSNRGNENVFADYVFSNNLFNAEENLIIFTKDKYSKNQFVTMSAIEKENVENSTFKDKNIAISYSKGLKLDCPNQDKFFIIIDGDFEAFCVLDGHGPFGHKVAQFVEEFFFKGLTTWRSKHESDKMNIEVLIKELFKDCQNALSSSIVSKLILYTIIR